MTLFTPNTMAFDFRKRRIAKQMLLENLDDETEYYDAREAQFDEDVDEPEAQEDFDARDARKAFCLCRCQQRYFKKFFVRFQK